MNQSIRNRKMYLLSAVVLLITFVLGTFTGAGIMMTFNCHKGPPLNQRDGNPAFHPLPLQELNLSGQQQEQVMSIIEKNRHTLDEIFEQTFPKLQIVTNAMEVEIRKLLNDEQKNHFDSMIERRKQMRSAPPHRKGPMPF